MAKFVPQLCPYSQKKPDAVFFLGEEGLTGVTVMISFVCLVARITGHKVVTWQTFVPVFFSSKSRKNTIPTRSYHSSTEPIVQWQCEWLNFESR